MNDIKVNQRKPSFHTVNEMIDMMRLKKFPFELAESEMSPEQLSQFIQAVDNTHKVQDIAWRGGDEYMQVYANYLLSAKNRLTRRSDLESISLLIIKSQGEEFEDYLHQLQRHDWYYSFSDDINVYRYGEQREKELKKFAEEKQGMYLIAWNAKVKERSDNINKKR